MKRKKTLLVLCAVLAILIVAIIVTKLVVQHIDTVNTIDEEVFTITEDDLTQVAISYGDNEVTLVKTDGVWTYSEDEGFPVDQDFVADMLSYFESVHASFIIDDVEDYSQYDLENPEATLTFTTADGDSVITFGTYSTIDEKRYICVDGGSVYLIDDDLLNYISATVEDYLDRDEVSDYYQLSTVDVSGDSTVSVVYDPDGEYTYTDAYDYYAVEDGEYKALSTTKIDNLLSTLQSMDLSVYETYKATSDDLAEYGLDNPTLTITLSGEVEIVSEEEEAEAEEEETTEETTDESSYSDSTTEETEETTEDTEEEDEDVETESETQTIYLSKVDDDNAYLYFEGSTIVYDISVDTYDDLADTSYETLRPDEIVNIDWTNVTEMTAEIEDDTYTVSVAYDEDDGNTYTVDDETVDFVTATSLIDTLTLEEVGTDYSKGTQELAFTITLNDEEYTTINVVLYQYDGDYCVATVDDETVGLVSRSSMSSLREEIVSAVLNKGKEADEDEEE